ncbi:MAG: dihydrofolate reductase [Rikenellaceae bacterium]
MINVIVAVAQNRVIGGENRLLWHISEDLRHFKAITSGHPVVMGRKTFESLGRPLPNRENVVITRSQIEIEGCRVVHSLEEAFALFRPKDQVFVIGGAEIYKASMPLADRFYLTRVHRDYKGDTSYPEWSESEWSVVSREHFERGEKYEYPYTFEEYRRVATSDSDHCIAQAARCDVEIIHQLAADSFRDTYKDIVAAEQVEWMFDDMYSIESLERQFDEGQLYFILYERGEAIGYLSLDPHGERLVHLEKLYIIPSSQGKGYGDILIKYAFAKVKQMCGGESCRVELNVNRHNKAVNFYFRQGMKIAREGDFVIEGTDFIRPDYILYKEL